MRNQALPAKIYDANNGLTYALHGDYYLLLIEVPQDGRPIGKYGRMRKMYLKEHRPVLYNKLEFVLFFLLPESVSRVQIDTPCDESSY